MTIAQYWKYAAITAICVCYGNLYDIMQACYNNRSFYPKIKKSHPRRQKCLPSSSVHVKSMQIWLVEYKKIISVVGGPNREWVTSGSPINIKDMERGKDWLFQ